MLVLTRKQGQKILVGDDIEVTVLSIRGSEVRLGISAPRTVPIKRQELVDAVAAQNVHATGAADEISLVASLAQR